MDVVYADSLNPVSRDGFHFSGDKKHADMSASFKASIAKVEDLPCDVVVSVHPSFTDTFKKLAGKTANANPFLSPGGCRAYATAAGKSLTAWLDREQQEKSAARP